MTLPHTLLTDGAHDAHIAFWTSALGHATGDLHLRQPWLSPPVSREETFTSENVVTPDVAAIIEELGRGQDLGSLVVIVGAVSILLQVYTQVSGVVVDSPPLAGGDGETGPEGLEAVPLVTAVDRARSVREYLTSVSETVAGSYSHQSFPVAAFSELRLKKARPSTNVLITFVGLHETIDHAPYDLRVNIFRNSTLGLTLTGRPPSLSPEYLHTFARHLRRVLLAFQDRDARIGDIDVLGDQERARLLVEYNGGDLVGDAAVADDRTIHGLVEEQAARAGSSLAVCLDDSTVTYDTLNRRANQLARALEQDYGVQKGDVIGVVTRRSPDTMVGLLGVLKSGAVYLPIDPDYPEERLKFMVADAAVKMLLVHSEHFDTLMALYETPMFALDIQLDSLETDDTDLGPTCTADDLAYIIYTSGSTGQPKAVLLEHRGFVAMVRHHITAFDIQPTDRLLQFYGHSFDSSLFEMFVSLASGAMLVMVDRDTIGDPARLSAYVATHAVTTLTLPPVYAGTLNRDHLASVRRFISAGDHCRVDDALRLAATGDYYNSYGPTETSVCVTHYKVDPTREYGSRIPIGRPITGTSIYLLDDEMKPVPDGVVGEICVGGAGLARGYLGRDDLTAAKFVPSPFAPNQRLYRTGDLGVWLPDGNLEVIGRKDNQVKVRGYRVELGEIESVLDQHPSVRESAVIAREDDAGHKRLAAYVTSDNTVDITGLRTFLQGRLPEFMLPSTLAVLDQLPLTANGKIVRQALATMVEPSTNADALTGLPDTPLQQTLVGIWQEVLGADRVGIHDNVFDLGGDSILIIQIVARAREAGIKLAPNQLFDHQTIAALAEVATTAEPATPAEAEQGVLEGPSPLSPMQAWFFEQQFANAHHFNQSVSLEVPVGNFDELAAAEATGTLVAHHDALRLRFAQRDGHWTADYAPVPSTPPFEVVEVAATPAGLGEAILACQSSFDLSAGPLIRIQLLKLSDGRPWRLLFVAHHLVVDGVSWRVLLSDFSSAYAQIASGGAVSLPPKTASFRTWTTQLAQVAPTVASGPWLASEKPTAALPLDHQPSPGANTVGSTDDVTITLDTGTTTALLQEVPRAYTTEVNDILLSGLAMTFQAWTGDEDVLLDLEGHGRDDLLDAVDTSRTVGWFTAQFPVRLTIDPQATPDEVIKSVKEQLRAIPGRGSGYSVLRYLSTNEDIVEQLKARPTPEILFNYFGQAGRVLAPELQWTLAPGATGGDISPSVARPHLLEINAMVADGCLTITWTYSEAFHCRETIERLAAQYEGALKRLVAHGLATTTKQYTPSDFPSAGLDQKSLDALVSKLNR